MGDLRCLKLSEQEVCLTSDSAVKAGWMMRRQQSRIDPAALDRIFAVPFELFQQPVHTFLRRTSPVGGELEFFI